MRSSHRRLLPIGLLTAATLPVLAALAAVPAGAQSAEGPACRPATPPAAASSAARCTASPPSPGDGTLLALPVSVAAADVRAAIDPETGELVVPPRPAPEVPRTLLGALRVPYGDLRQEPLPGGGWKLGLRGRSLNPLFATVEDDGRVTARHGTAEPRRPERDRPEEDRPHGERPEVER